MPDSRASAPPARPFQAAPGLPAASVLAPATPLSSAQLLGGRDAVRIEHRGEHYVLRATRAGKLILTK